MESSVSTISGCFPECKLPSDSVSYEIKILKILKITTNNHAGVCNISNKIEMESSCLSLISNYEAQVGLWWF